MVLLESNFGSVLLLLLKRNSLPNQEGTRSHQTSEIDLPHKIDLLFMLAVEGIDILGILWKKEV